MRVLLQRVSRAEVRVEGQLRGAIQRGYLLYAAFMAADTVEVVEWVAEKVATLRLFGDADGKMNLSLGDVQGALLVVSQFTLYGDASKGRRPSFMGAARPETAIPLYEGFIATLRARGIQVETGDFGAMMEVESINDGPVTLWIER